MEISSGASHCDFPMISCCSTKLGTAGDQENSDVDVVRYALVTCSPAKAIGWMRSLLLKIELLDYDWIITIIIITLGLHSG